VARLQSGEVKPLGLRALLDACSKSHLVKHVDLSNHDLSSPRLFSLVVTLVQQARDLRVLSLGNTNISNQHALDLAAAIQSASHLSLEGLDVANNKCDPCSCCPMLVTTCCSNGTQASQLFAVLSLGSMPAAAQTRLLCDPPHSA
jgi:hypothetical protein